MIGANAWGKLAEQSQKVVGMDFRMYYNMVITLSLTVTYIYFLKMLLMTSYRYGYIYTSLFMMEDNINIEDPNHSSCYSFVFTVA